MRPYKCRANPSRLGRDARRYVAASRPPATSFQLTLLVGWLLRFGNDANGHQGNLAGDIVFHRGR